VTIPPWEDPRRVLRRHGLRAKRRYSQSFLVSRHVVERIVLALEPREDELTVELGPGLGTLTGELLRAGARVHAVDLDPEMLAVLSAELGGVPTLSTEQGDAAHVDLRALAQGRRIALAGNLPYAATGAILRNLIAHRDVLRRAVIMVQREVRDRLVAGPGTRARGALGVFTQAAFSIHPVMRVSAGSFHPPPRVESAVVRLEPLDPPRAVEDDAFRAVVRAAFAQRRKTLRNALGNLDRGRAALDRAGVDGSRRAETLSVEELAQIARALDP